MADHLSLGSSVPLAGRCRSLAEKDRTGENMIGGVELENKEERTRADGQLRLILRCVTINRYMLSSKPCLREVRHRYVLLVTYISDSLYFITYFALSGEIWCGVQQPYSILFNLPPSFSPI